MPPKKQAVAEKAPKTSPADAFAALPAGAKLGLGGFVFAMLAVLWFATMDSSSAAATRGLIKSLGIKDAAVEIGYDPETGRPALVARRNLQPGQPFLTVPMESIVDQRSIGSAAIGRMFQVENGTIVNTIAHENQLSQGGFNMLIQAINFVYEKRKGAASSLAAFFAIVPEPTSTVLYWPEPVLACADMAIKAELAELLRVVNATSAVTTALCDTEEGREAGCQPVTPEEAKWGLGLYLQNNFQDQAFIPLINFAKIDNTKAGFQPQPDQKNNGLVFVAQGAVARGDVITTPYMRGPSQLVTQRGSFDAEQARGVELMLNLPQDDEAIKKYCTNAVTELQFASNGKPREGLVNCMSVLVANAGKERKRLAKNLRKNRTPEQLAHVWGNLTVAVQRLADGAADEDACAKAPVSPFTDALRSYNAWRRSTLEANANFVQQQMVEKYAVAGIPFPQGPPPPAGAPEEGEAAATPAADSDKDL